jgi:hypothetical protein
MEPDSRLPGDQGHGPSEPIWPIPPPPTWGRYFSFSSFPGEVSCQIGPPSSLSSTRNTRPAPSSSGSASLHTSRSIAGDGFLPGRGPSSSASFHYSRDICFSPPIKPRRLTSSTPRVFARTCRCCRLRTVPHGFVATRSSTRSMKLEASKSFDETLSRGDAVRISSGALMGVSALLSSADGRRAEIADFPMLGGCRVHVRQDQLRRA